MPSSYQYPRAALTVDCVVFGFDEGDLKVLLIERGLEPFKGRWALPGGFVRVEETLDADLAELGREIERLEAIEARGGNAFSEYSLPEAVLKLRQGIGRLIRSRQDRGIVVILEDGHILDTILYGVSYYHEYMPYERLDKDVELMQKAGVTVVRSWQTEA